MSADRGAGQPGSSGRPRATVISPNPANAAGGVERTCALLRPVLKDHGFDVEIVGPDREPTRWEGRLGCGPAALSRSAAGAALRTSPDLIISNGYLGWGCPLDVRRIHVFHGTMVGDTNAAAPFMPRRERLRRLVGAGAVEALCARGAITVSVSAEAASELRRYYRVRVDNVVPNGIDTATFSPGDRAAARSALGLDEGRRYALFVGRLEPRKGSDLVLAGASAAGYELLVAGPEGTPGATHLGVLDPVRLANAYRAADCMLFPTRYEGCSLAILEALASGVPLLTTTVGWMPTFLAAVPEYQALCVEPSVASITDRLRSLPQLVTDDLLSHARRYVLAEDSLGRWAERWHALLVRAGYPGPDRS